MKKVSSWNWRLSLLRKNKKRIRKSRRKTVLFLLIIVVFVGGFFLLRKRRSVRNSFYISEVIIQGKGRISPEEIFACLGVGEDRIITDTEENDIIEKLEENIWVEEVVLKEAIFGKIYIVIKERSPIAIVKDNGPSVLCSDGEVIPYSDEFSNLPSVYIEGGKEIYPYVFRINKIKDASCSHPITIYFMNSERTYVKMDGIKIIIGNCDLVPLVKEVYNIIKEMKEKGYTVCDMRFRNQIIFEKGGVI